VQGKITEADTPTIGLGAIPSGLISDPPPSSPIFRQDALLATTLPLYSWLGTGTKYAGLHTQWCGSYPEVSYTKHEVILLIIVINNHFTAIVQVHLLKTGRYCWSKV